MADITNEIAAIQVATTGSEIRTAIVNALNLINEETPDVYSGSYIITPSTLSQLLSVSGYAMSSNLTIEAFPVFSGSYIIVPSISSQTFSTSSHILTSDIMVEAVPYYSGSYTISASSISYTLLFSGLLMTNDLVVEAFPQSVLISKTVTSNGTYNAISDNADGYSVFTVSIPEYSGSYTIEPGAVSQVFSVSGMIMTSDLTINSAASEVSLISKAIISNGTYIASDDNADGYSSVTVNVPYIPNSWSGTQSAYDALSSYNSSTVYFIVSS